MTKLQSMTIRTIGDVREVVEMAIFMSTETLQSALAFQIENGNEDGVFARKIRAELTRRGIEN